MSTQASPIVQVQTVREYRTAHPPSAGKTGVTAAEFAELIRERIAEIGEEIPETDSTFALAMSWVENEYYIRRGTTA